MRPRALRLLDRYDDPSRTGGQFSLVRIAAAAVFVVHAVEASLLGGLEVALAVILGLGLRDRYAALGLIVTSIARGRLADSLGIFTPFDFLLLHVFVPRAPFLSFDARGRVDPAGEWRMPNAVQAVAHLFVITQILWAVQVGSIVSGVARLSAIWVLGIVLPLVASSISRLRPWLFLVYVAVVVAVSIEVDRVLWSSVVTLGVLFSPGWIPGREGERVTVFYDGACGLCHRAVRFFMAEDVRGDVAVFAPLHGDHFKSTVDPHVAGTIPDSVVLKVPGTGDSAPKHAMVEDTTVARTDDGTLFVRSDAILRVLQRLGGLWCLIAIVAGVLPRAARDLAYDAIARIRKKIFAPPPAACPILPPRLRSRFLH